MTTKQGQPCIFCMIATKQFPSDVIFEDKDIIAILDINPVNPGHTLIVPKEHYVDITETPDALLSSMMVHVARLAPVIMESVNADGFNVGINTRSAAGQVVFHTHVHIIPRFATDGLKHWPHQKLDKTRTQHVTEYIRSRFK